MAELKATAPVLVVGASFRFDGAQQVHVPQLLLEFEPVPVNAPCDAKGWKDRDAFAAAVNEWATKKTEVEPVRILRVEMDVAMGLRAYLLTDFTVKTMSPTQADKIGWWKHGEHKAPV